MSGAEPPAPRGAPSVYGVDDDRPQAVVAGRCVVCSVDEIPPGERRIFAIGGRGGIGVFNVGGHFYAIRNLCPHRAGPLCRGRLRPHVVGPEVAQFAFEREGEILKCPWHQWEFDLRTGQSLYAPHLAVQTYPVEVAAGQIVLVLDEDAARSSLPSAGAEQSVARRTDRED